VRRHRHYWLLLLPVIGMGALGNLIGELLGQYLPVLTQGVEFSIGPVAVDLYVVGITLGASLSLNLAGFVGALIGFLLFRRF